MCKNRGQVRILARWNLASGIVVRNDGIFIPSVRVNFNTRLLVKARMWAISAGEADRLALARATIDG